MIRTLSLAVLTAMMLCSQASAEFIIDYFKFVDTNPSAGDAVLVHAAGGGNIFVDASVSGGTVFNAAGGYGATNMSTAGDSFTVRYTWDVATFGDLQSLSGLVLPSVPHFGGLTGFDLTIFDGSSNLFSGSAFAANGALAGTPPVLDPATELTFTYTRNASPLLPGQDFVGFGGPGAPLFATPEPTALTMLGAAAAFGLARRRRR